MNDAWDPQQYERFREERQAPFYDLLKLVLPKKSMRIVDLGCGTGELTREMHRHFKAAETVGVDASDAMLAKSTELDEKGLSFRKGRIEDVDATEQFDLVLSNAALHWVPDHARILERLTRSVAENGQLAVQMPANVDHPSRVVADELAREEPYRSALGGEGVRQYTLPVERYATLLHELGYRKQHVKLQVYAHRLAKRDDVVEWVKGAMLTDLKRMGDELYEQFLVKYRERLLPRLVEKRPYLYTFKRIFFWAER